MTTIRRARPPPGTYASAVTAFPDFSGTRRPAGPSRRGRAIAHRPGWGLAVRASLRVVVVLLLLTAVVQPRTAAAQQPDQDVVRLLIVDRAAAHGIASAPLACTLWRESRWRPSARGSSGEVGLAQWLPPVDRNAWGQTSAWRLQGIDIGREYRLGNPDAAYFDVDAAAELFARGAPTRRAHWGATYCEFWPATGLPLVRS